MIVSRFPLCLSLNQENIVGYDAGFIVGGVAEHVLSDSVSQSPDPLFAGLEIFVHPDPALPVDFHSCPLRAEKVGIRAPACGKEDLLSLELPDFAILCPSGRDDLFFAIPFHR